MTSTTLEKLIEQRNTLDKRIQKEQAREAERKRKEALQRKILVGSFYLAEAERLGTQDELKKKMDTFLTRASDRKLFDLPTKE